MITVVGVYPIPELIAGGLARYVLGNIETGSGLRAILEGDLFKACGRCDGLTVSALPAITRAIVNLTPPICWGSSSRVGAWVRGGDEGSTMRDHIKPVHKATWAPFLNL